MAATARLFTALWPSAAVRAALLTQRARWVLPAGARPVAPAKLHITLHFLGSQPVELIPALRGALAGPVVPFELQLDRAEVWPNGVALLAPAEPPAALDVVHHAQADALRALGLKVERRRYRPHLTLARDARGATPPAECGAIVWPVHELVLVQSLPDGRYQPLAR